MLKLNKIIQCVKIMRPAKTKTEKGADTRPRPASAYPRAPLLHVVVEEKLVWMRTQTQGIVLFALVRDPHLQKVRREDVALQEKVMVFLQTIQGFTEATGHVWHFLQLFGRQFVDVLVQWFARIDLVLNPI